MRQTTSEPLKRKWQGLWNFFATGQREGIRRVRPRKPVELIAEMGRLFDSKGAVFWRGKEILAFAHGPRPRVIRQSRTEYQ
jgi:hypothetical protein